jgi:hypothetical protein
MIGGQLAVKALAAKISTEPLDGFDVPVRLDVLVPERFYRFSKTPSGQDPSLPFDLLAQKLECRIIAGKNPLPPSAKPVDIKLDRLSPA